MLSITPYHQKPGFCGPATVKMVLAYFGIEKSEDELGLLMGTTPEMGTDISGFLHAAEVLGFKATSKGLATIDDIRQFVLEKKVPVIVDWFSIDDGHYSVVVDIDDEKIYLQDPKIGDMRVMDIPTFMRLWFDFPGAYIENKDDLDLRRMIVFEKK